jgi:hypothetical protein
MLKKIKHLPRPTQSLRMTNISRNVLNDVLRCVQRCGEHQKTLGGLTAQERDSAQQLAMDMLQDMEIELCNLAASLVTAPISGRIFIPLPPEYIDKQVQAESMHAQLRPARLQ